MLAILFIVSVVAFIVISIVYAKANDRKDARYFEELGKLRDERQGLVQRIQAPDMAVLEHAQRNLPEHDPNPYPLTEAESAAEQGVTQALIQQIERMEREGVDMHMPHG